MCWQLGLSQHHALFFFCRVSNNMVDTQMYELGATLSLNIGP